MMTVRQLIAELQKQDQDMLVFTTQESGPSSGECPILSVSTTRLLDIYSIDNPAKYKEITAVHLDV